MIEQEITIQLSDDPLDTVLTKVKVPHGTKIISREPYAIDMMHLYEESDNENNYISESDSNSVINGEIVSILKNSSGRKTTALIDLGTKYTASCPLLKESKEIVDQLEIGMNIDVMIKRELNGEITASISGALDKVKVNEIIESIGNNSVAFKGKITELIHGGYWVNVSGIQCFMPGSLAGLNKLWDFESLIGKELVVMPVSFSNEKNTIVVSHRAYLNTLIPGAVDELKNNFKEKIIGKVTGTTKFGVFAEFNQCLTGLIPNTELDGITLSQFNDREINPGDSIEFWIKEIINDSKIILSQLSPPIDLWDGIEDKYKPMMVVTGTVTRITKYGLFIELEKGISGLIHKSKINNSDFNKGDKINVRIQNINPIDRRIILTPIA